MEDWVAIGIDSVAAAKALHTAGHYRSCVSRSYFGAYAAIASALEGAIQYPDGREGPGHAALPRLVTSNLKGLNDRGLRRVKQSIRMLYKARVDADYRPSSSPDRESSRDAIRAACAVRRELELPE